MVTIMANGVRCVRLSDSMLTQLPTPELCISNTPLAPPIQAPTSMATPSSSVVSVTTCRALSARQRRISRACPASGTKATRLMPWAFNRP